MSEVSKQFLTVMIILPCLTNLFMFVQAYKVWIRRSHDDISLLTVLFTLFSTLAWGVYGYYLKSVPLMVSSFTASLGLSLLLWLKVTIPANEQEWKYV
jgi:MtN3 and saliva related transmembrane protein